MNSLLRALLILSVISTGMAIKCFICNSFIDESCYDLVDESKREKYLTDCGDKEEKQNYTMCRKLHIFLDQDFGEVNKHGDRVQRDCAYIGDEDVAKKKGGCYYKSGYNTRTWVCSCKDDECNAASNVNLTPVALVLAVVTALANRM